MKLSFSDRQIVDVAATSASIFESMSFTATCQSSSGGSSILPPPGLGGSFQFRHDFMSLDSVDLSGFGNPNRKTPESNARISWRDGLVSRIFEMGEKDCCIWLSDCEDDGPELEDTFEVDSKISSNHDARCSFPSIELHAKSINVEGEDELVLNTDSLQLNQIGGFFFTKITCLIYEAPNFSYRCFNLFIYFLFHYQLVTVILETDINHLLLYIVRTLALVVIFIV
jgi:hypothetical protein